MHDKYINAYNQTWLEIRNEEKPKDWSQELVQKAEKYKNKFEVIKKNIENEKISKKGEPYKASLLQYFNNEIELFDLGIKEIKYKLDKKSEKEKEIEERANKIFENKNQFFYELENEYSKVINGKPATVMGVNGANYLAYTASNVDMAVIEGRWQTDAIGSNPYLKKKPIGMFAIFKVFVKNNQKDAITVDSNSFKLVDNQKREYSVSHEAETALQMENGDTKGFLTQLNPGMATDFTFVFDVPQELNRYNTKLVATGGFSGKKVEMPIYPVKISQVKQ